MSVVYGRAARTASAPPGARIDGVPYGDVHLIDAADEVVHLMHVAWQGHTSCCGRTPFELPRTDRMTFDPALRTCDADADSRGES